MSSIYEVRDHCVYIADDLAPNQDKERLIAECSNNERAEQIAEWLNLHDELVGALRRALTHLDASYDPIPASLSIYFTPAQELRRRADRIEKRDTDIAAAHAVFTKATGERV
jgi:hypothetical protein